jgi:CheY-like chemotaxis protein
MKKVNCILLIDDNPADNDFHKIIIKEANICDHIEVVLNGLEALEYIRKSADSENDGKEFPKPNIIFLDINMPRMNGFEFLDEYKKLDEKLKSEVVIVMLTTSLNPDDAKRAKENSEVKEFQNKPLTVESLKDVVDKYFNE